MESIASLRGKGQRLRHAARRIPNLTLDIESPREAYLSDDPLAAIAASRAFSKRCMPPSGDWWRVIRAWQRDGLAARRTPTPTCTATYGDDEILPWDFIDHRIAKSYLWVERRQGLRRPPDGALRHEHVS
jgi:hypothetical protein